VADKTICQEIRDWQEAQLAYWRPIHEGRTEQRNFLDGDRYENDNGEYARDRRLIQIKGQEIQDTHRHIVAKATEKPRSIETRPVDSTGEDADTGEAMGSVVEWYLSRPELGFDDCLEEVLLDSREAQAGMMWMDLIPAGEVSPFAEAIFSYQDINNVMWDPQYPPHHPLCGQILRSKRVPVSMARKAYKAPWLQSDREAIPSRGRSGGPVMQNRGSRDPNPPDDDKITLWECWYKHDRTMSHEATYGENSPIKPEERYMSCGCGYRSPTQGVLRAQDKVVDELPMELEGGCPECEGKLDRIDARQEAVYSLAYQKGKRLVIMAPYCAESKADKPLYDGAWPVPKARSFPCLYVTSYVKAGKPMGPSDTMLMWNQQQASDELATVALQRVLEHRTVWEMPRTGIVDGHGRRYNFREDQHNVMFRDGTVAQQYDLTVKAHNVTGLDPAWAVAYGAVQEKLTAYRGMHDQGPIEARTKAKSGVALQTENAIGEVPVAHFNRRKNRAISMFYGIVSDYIQAILTPERAARLRIDGIDLIVSMMGDDLPSYDFIIEDTPDFTGLEEARAKAFEGLLGAFERGMTLGLDPVPIVELFAKVNNLPRGVTREFVKMLMAKQEEAEMEAEVMGPEMDAAQQAEMQALMGQQSEAGMVPAAA
jgi:hypothetical protein